MDDEELSSEIDWSLLDQPIYFPEPAEPEESFADEISNVPESVQEELARSDVGFEDLELTEAELEEGCSQYLSGWQTDELEQLALPPSWVDEMTQCWQGFLDKINGRQAAGLAIHDAAKEAAPDMIRDDFKMPRPLWASRFVDGIANMVSVASDSKRSKYRAERIAFVHIHLAVSASKCEVIRDAVLYVLEAGLGPGKVSPKARRCFIVMLNYMTGALIYVQNKFYHRVRDIGESWAQANKKLEEEHSTKAHEEDDKKMSAAKKRRAGLNVPKTFNEMFLFNACLMGYEEAEWMDIILDRMDCILCNVAQLQRLQVECDLISLIFTKYHRTIDISDYRVVLLATLRSLVKGWSMDMETAWNWFWDRVESMLTDRKTLGSCAKKLRTELATLNETHLDFLKRQIFHHFFHSTPKGQEFLKTSMTRLYFVADKIIEMTLEMFDDPVKMVEEVNSLGLMHVGYNVPREFFEPFAGACKIAFKEVAQQEVSVFGFNWAITLISRIMSRVSKEGTTMVMKAICLNDKASLKEAMVLAPRGERHAHLLEVSAGSQSISPLFWSVNSGNLECARLIIEDLLTIRADRDNYYYGCDALFEWHPDVVGHLCSRAPILLWPLLDGLIWRSRITQNGWRRVNYFIKNLLQDQDGGFSKSIQWIVGYNDPKVISHPSSAMALDLVWFGLVMRYFLMGRAFFFISLGVFLAGQSFLIYHTEEETYEENLAVAACRAFTYLVSMGSLVSDHVKHLCVDYQRGQIDRTFIPIPRYLLNARALCSLFLTCSLMTMLCMEPILWCLPDSMLKGSEIQHFSTNCNAVKDVKSIYSAGASIASLLFWVLIMDLGAFSMRFYSYLIVCGQVVMEVVLFLAAVCFGILAFATTLNAVKSEVETADGVQRWAQVLVSLVLDVLPKSYLYEFQSNTFFLLMLSMFIGLTSFFLLNLLAVQMMEAYQTHFEDLPGCARLSRAEIVVRTMEQVSSSTWTTFLKSMQFDECLEFNEGDVGLAGGTQVLESVHTSIVLVDRIRRFGGSTEPSLPWPEEVEKSNTRQDHLSRLEALMMDSISKEKAKHAIARKPVKKKSLTLNAAMKMMKKGSAMSIGEGGSSDGS